MKSSIDQSNNLSIGRGNKFKGCNPWDAAIAEAKQRIRDLKFSIKDFEERKARGEKWLGKVDRSQSSERQHAV